MAAVEQLGHQTPRAATLTGVLTARPLLQTDATTGLRLQLVTST
jgi:hypothetical protein